MEGEILRKLQLVESDILKQVDEFCKKHKIKYSLYAGTLLGAVRHGGFIPWDDDIDIFMERNEYERFLKLWQSEGVEGYTIEATNSPDYQGLNHTKIRKDGTILASKKEMETETHHGIWLDIFPLDKVPTNKKKRKKYLFRAKLRLVYTRGFAYEKGGKLLKLISKILLIPPRKTQLKIRNKIEKKSIYKYKDLTSGYEYMSLSASENFKLFFPPEVVENISTINFEGEVYSAVKDYDKMLSIIYGDYMRLPPEDQRICKHNPEVLDFGE